MRSPTVHVLLMLLCASVAAPAHAQEPAEEKVALTPEQLDLNNKAIRALTQDPPDVERAIRLVSAADLVGTPNKLIAMTHARARQLAGECHAAERSYDELSGLPGVQGVSTEQLMTRAEKYREELVDCFATVVLSCERPAETSVKLDGVDGARCGTGHRVDPGSLAVFTKVGDSEQREILSLEPGRTRVYEIRVPEGHDARSAMSAAKVRVKTALVSAEGVVAERIRANAERLREQAKGRNETAAARSEVTGAEPAARPVEESAAARTAAPPPPAPRQEGWVGSQAGISVPVGVFSARRPDGLSDGGLTYGVQLHGAVGYAFAQGLAVDVRSAFTFRRGNGFGAYQTSIDEQAIVFDLEPRFWADFLGVGPSLHYRSQRLEVAEQESNTSGRTAAGLTLVVSTRGVQRGDGVFDVYARWLPLFGGSAGTFATGFRASGRYATFDLGYMVFNPGDSTPGKFEQAESLLLSFGVKIPILSPVLEANQAQAHAGDVR